ncbi:hypothetical protein RRG08_009538 [Elysia crispata]|uniref:Uncharacterized protein n=1 Tax=Elysia crispata TaxID=231223 RepID=A0AAE1B3G4_9GAST|nr:hypothetical protein RRG08_009538 [Elysia crispata]
MRGVCALAICLILSLTVLLRVEAISFPFRRPYYNPYRIYARDVGDADQDVAKRGWARDKWDQFSDNVNKNIQAADEAVTEFFDTLHTYRKLYETIYNSDHRFSFDPLSKQFTSARILFNFVSVKISATKNFHHERCLSFGLGSYSFIGYGGGHLPLLISSPHIQNGQEEGFASGQVE